MLAEQKQKKKKVETEQKYGEKNSLTIIFLNCCQKNSWLWVLSAYSVFGVENN